MLTRILLFDWWIRNCDRALTETGGNPNLLWELDPGRVVAFDHDNAFDENFDATHFWQYHALRGHLSAWDPAKRAEMAAWLASGEALIDRLWDELPEEWLHDSYGDPRCTLDKGGLKAVLPSHQTELDFWSLPISTAP